MKIERIKASGFPDSVVSVACDKLVKNVKAGPARGERLKTEKKKVPVILYIHRMSHGLKKIASEYEVNVFFCFF